MDRPPSFIAGVLALVTTTATAAPPERSSPAVQVRPEGPGPPPPATSTPVEPPEPTPTESPAPGAPDPEPAALPDSPGLVPAPTRFEADPLADVAWQRRSRRLTIATATLGGLTGAAFTGFVASRVFTVVLGVGEDDFSGAPKPGYQAAQTAMLTTVLLDGALAIAVIGVAAARERHLERAVGARVPDLRLDPTWRVRDRQLTWGLWTAGTIAGAGGVCYTTVQYFGAGDASGLIVLPLCGVVGGAALITIAVLGSQRIRHRGRLNSSPRITSGGLSWRF